METKNFRDNRGLIETLCKGADVLRITSIAGSRRAGHFHKESSHWCLVTKGSIIYYSRPTNSNKAPSKEIFCAGDIFFTDKMEDHLMTFPEYTEFYCFSLGDRSQSSYENDLVRLEVDLAQEFFKNFI